MDDREILIVTETLGVDGPERVISELSQEWDRKGYKITIVVTRNKNKIAMYSFSPNVSIVHVDAYEKGGRLYRLKEILQIRRILKDNPAIVCISLMVSTSFSLAIASMGLHKRLILSERNDPSRVPFTAIQRKLRDLSFELADRIVFQTHDAMAYFPKRIQKKGKIIYNPVNPDLPTRYTGKRDKKIVAVGRLAEQKNFGMLIQAFSQLEKKHSEYRLVIYGEGNCRDDLQKLINDLGLNQKIMMPGFNSNVYDEMMRCAMYVSSSDYEGMSNSMLEALAMGIPTICTDCPIGGAHTIIKNRVNGILVPVGNAEELFKEMTYLIEHPTYAGAISEEAYKLREELNVSEISRKWESLF